MGNLFGRQQPELDGLPYNVGKLRFGEVVPMKRYYSYGHLGSHRPWTANVEAARAQNEALMAAELKRYPTPAEFDYGSNFTYGASGARQRRSQKSMNYVDPFADYNYGFGRR